MNREMGPCPKCRRHVYLTEHRCPFCGATWLVSAAAAVSLLFGSAEAAPVPDRPVTVVEQEQEYGVPRTPVDRKFAEWVWNSLSGDWKGHFGFSPVTSSWGGLKVGANVRFNVEKEGEVISLRVALDRADDREAALSVEFDDYRVGAKRVSLRPAVPPEATVTEAGRETLEADGRKFDCAITRYEWPGTDVRVWKSGDRILRVQTEEEKSSFVKTEEIEVAKKKIRCEIWETVRGGATIREWRSTEIPGGIARVESGKRKIVVTSFDRGR